MHPNGQVYLFQGLYTSKSTVSFKHISRTSKTNFRNWKTDTSHLEVYKFVEFETDVSVLNHSNLMT